MATLLMKGMLLFAVGLNLINAFRGWRMLREARRLRELSAEQLDTVIMLNQQTTMQFQADIAERLEYLGIDGADVAIVREPKAEHATIKIGKYPHMVAIDSRRFDCNPNAALEAAAKDWHTLYGEATS